MATRVTPVEVAYYYNLQEGRGQAIVNRELAAMLDTGPLVLSGCEGVGYDLGKRRGYTLLRDRSTQGRANVFAYVRKDPRHPLGVPHWTDLEETWHRTQHPGTHPPRAILRCRVGRLQLLVGHAPPRFTDNTLPAQTEHARAMLQLMTHGSQDRPRLALADWNQDPSLRSVPGPRHVAQAIGGSVVGHKIDCAVTRNLPAASGFYVSRVGGVQLHSDHADALRVAFPLRPVQPPE